VRRIPRFDLSEVERGTWPNWDGENGLAGGSFSNWWCSVFNVDLALSVALTTISTASSVFMLPLNLFVYARLAYGHSVQV
jgi:hypothetical protein